MVSAVHNLIKQYYLGRKYHKQCEMLFERLGGKVDSSCTKPNVLHILRTFLNDAEPSDLP